jgi:hypothetical protein
MRAFDGTKGHWTSDYPSDTEELKIAFSISGTGRLLASGNPAPGNIVDAVAWDSKRKRLIYAMPGMTAAYDPISKIWVDLQAKSALPGQSKPPTVRGAGIAYDPINDEVLLFPHWDYVDQTRRSVDGRRFGHAGSLIYRFADNQWHSARELLGPAEVRYARDAVVSMLGCLSNSLDRAWALRRIGVAAASGAAEAEAIACELEQLADSIESLNWPDSLGEAQEQLSDAATPLRAAATSARAGEIASALNSGRDALTLLETTRDEELRLEPSPRSGGALVYHPEKEVIVMFGGLNGRSRKDDGKSGVRVLGDTWLYDPRQREWREIAVDQGPPHQSRARMVYDPVSKQVLLVTLSFEADEISLWSLDLETERWTQRHKQPWSHEVARLLPGDARLHLFELAIDEQHNLLLMPVVSKAGETTFVMRLDLQKLPSKPALKRTPKVPLGSLELPEDDPKWLNTLKSLTPNTWVNTAGGFAERDWGNIAYDPIRDRAVLFGGGHSTFQFNTVSIYVVGANKWVNTTGYHNDHIPPVEWGGISTSFDGGPSASHQRNTYVAIDGRMYTSAGFSSYFGDKKPNNPEGLDLGPRYSIYLDIDRGGLWRSQMLAGDVQLKNGAKGAWGARHVVDPRGRVLGLIEGPKGYYDYSSDLNEMFFSAFDIYTNTASVTLIPPPYPPRVSEMRPFAYMPDKRQIFYCTGGYTGVYDEASNKMKRLDPKVELPARVRAVVYLSRHSAALAGIDDAKQPFWAYSFDHNTWAPLPTDKQVSVDAPYGKIVYSAKHDVVINVRDKEAHVMRPDLAAAFANYPAPSEPQPITADPKPDLSETCTPCVVPGFDGGVAAGGAADAASGERGGANALKAPLAGGCALGRGPARGSAQGAGWILALLLGLGLALRIGRRP